MSRRPSPVSCHSDRGPSPASATGAGRRCRPRASQSAETAKVAAVDEQRRRRAQDGDQRPGRQEADHLRQLQRDVGQRGGDGVAVALEHVGHQRRPGRLERWRAQRHQEQQRRAAPAAACPGIAISAEQRGPGDVGGDEHPVPGQPVGERGQQRAAEQPRQVADREGQRRQQRGGGALVDQHRQRHPGQLVAGRGQQERAEQRPELADGEDLAERRRPGRRAGGVGVPAARRGQRTRTGTAAPGAVDRQPGVRRERDGHDRESTHHRNTPRCGAPCQRAAVTGPTEERDRCVPRGRRAGRRPARPSG